MKNRPRFTRLSVLVSLTLILAIPAAPAFATPADWVVPWGQLTQNTIAVFVEEPDVNENVPIATHYYNNTAYYGALHGMTLRFQDKKSLLSALIITAPATGTILYINDSQIYVETDGGDLYFLSLIDSMYSFSEGDRVGAGEAIGQIDVVSPYHGLQPKLIFEYLVRTEPDSLFGVSRQNFTAGADLARLGLNAYDPSNPPASASLPDLAPDAVTADSGYARVVRSMQGTYTIFETGRPIALDSGVINFGPAASGPFNVKWYIDGAEEGYGMHEAVPAMTDEWNGNSEFSWTPQAGGAYTVTFVVDCDNHVRESDENNNEVSVIVQVAD